MVKTRYVLEQFLSNKISLHTLERYLANECRYGEIAGIEKDIWIVIDEIMGIASLEGRQIREEELNRIRDLISSRLKT